FITVISLIGSLNILNTITISIIIRRKELAALKSIGMSQRNLKKMIIYEALIYGFSGSLQGIFFGCILSYIIYLAASGVLRVEWTIPYEACLITFVSALIISFLSVLLPLRKIQNDNIIDVIREQ
ncbi:FtsX-like permease family protein, partial [Brevibacillus porteri]|uniref:FtsX-like permease family protein n=1 Tax=Brevibacillus porteri TaxID=2126350 RepID=UPI003638B73A